VRPKREGLQESEGEPPFASSTQARGARGAARGDRGGPNRGRDRQLDRRDPRTSCRRRRMQGWVGRRRRYEAGPARSDRRWSHSDRLGRDLEA